MKGKSAEAKARAKILKAAESYCKKFHAGKPYKPGDRISYAGRVFGPEEMSNLIDSSLDFWLTAGRYTEEFEKKFAAFLGVKYGALVNSGSSANLLAFMALTSPLLKDRAIKRGDEVITAAAGFPTTVAPIIQYGAVPVFIDVAIPQYNIDVKQLKAALTAKTKAVMLAHTLGNPFDLDSVPLFCRENNLWLIEDNCDSLGSKYKGRYTGTIGDIGTSSFYPPHHMTMGEGGAVYTDNPLLYRIMLSMRDWGRDCVCRSGVDNSCGKRFEGQFGQLPKGYDHKYVYSHFGYNLKATDMQAAIGAAQLKKLPVFMKKRVHNFNLLKESLSGLENKIILPAACENSEPSWFGFLITLKEKNSREKLVKFLESKNIQTRMLFAGNIIKHPCFDAMRARKIRFADHGPEAGKISSADHGPEAGKISFADHGPEAGKISFADHGPEAGKISSADHGPEAGKISSADHGPEAGKISSADHGPLGNDEYRIVGSLPNTDRIMNDTFWVGVYPGMNDAMIKYMAESIREGLR